METKEEIRPQSAKVLRSRTLASKNLGSPPVLKKITSMSHLPHRKSNAFGIHKMDTKLEIFVITWNMNGKVLFN
jgi:hypothetical protein